MKLGALFRFVRNNCLFPDLQLFQLKRVVANGKALVIRVIDLLHRQIQTLPHLDLTGEMLEDTALKWGQI